jgi:hypothetical protein
MHLAEDCSARTAMSDSVGCTARPTMPERARRSTLRSTPFKTMGVAFWRSMAESMPSTRALLR